MANVLLVGVEQTIAAQIRRAVAVERHNVEQRSHEIAARDLTGADIVFAGGEASQYLSLLRQVRHDRPALPVVVITPVPQTAAWLEALESGATDCCSPPFDSRQIAFLMGSASRPRVAHQ